MTSCTYDPKLISLSSSMSAVKQPLWSVKLSRTYSYGAIHKLHNKVRGRGGWGKHYARAKDLGLLGIKALWRGGGRGLKLLEKALSNLWMTNIQVLISANIQLTSLGINLSVVCQLLLKVISFQFFLSSRSFHSKMLDVEVPVRWQRGKGKTY